MNKLNLITEDDNTLEVNYEIAQAENIFGITITQGQEQRTEFFTEDKSKAEEILQFCVHNETMIESLGDSIDSFYNI